MTEQQDLSRVRSAFFRRTRVLVGVFYVALAAGAIACAAAAV
ncbi:MAG TPA: hypothetical protein VNT58_07570 [Gaiellaceae bacterium]|nr:hypothetical protein [Gaiellaceae bacterium]